MLEARTAIVATATIARTAATAVAGIIAGASFINPHFATHPLSAVKGFDYRIFLSFFIHINECKATGTTGFPIGRKADSAYFAILAKYPFEIFAGDIIRQVTNIN